MIEEWKPILEFIEYYEVSNLGRIRRIKGGSGTRSGKILKLSTYGGSYINVDLCKDGKVHYRQVHVLVLEAFTGPKPTIRHECNHIDGNKENNCHVNLEWTTHVDNSLHKHHVLGKAFGKTHYKSRMCYIIVPDGTQYIAEALTTFCREHNLSSNKMGEVARHTLKHYKGWKCAYV